MSNVYETAKSAASDATSRVAAMAPDDLTEAAGRLQDEASFQMDRLSETIRNKPIQSAAIAAGIGFLFAVIARR